MPIALLAIVVVFFTWQQWIYALTTSTPQGRRPVGIARISGPRGGTWTQASLADAFAVMSSHLDRVAPPEAPLVGWSALAIFNFYTGRPNPTHLDYYWPGTIDARREEALLRELRAAPPAAVVISQVDDPIWGSEVFFQWHPALRRYVRGHYRLVGAVDDWEIHARMDPDPGLP